MEEGVESGEDSRRVAIMLGRRIKEDLRNQQYDREINSGERAARLSLNKRTWWLLIDYANIRWHTVEYLRLTPGNIQEWLKKGTITEDLVKGIFEHQYRPYYKPREKRRRMPNQKGFTVLNEQTQWPEKKLKQRQIVKDRALKGRRPVAAKRKELKRATGEELRDHAPIAQGGKSRA
jgi:hypothetical protein